MLANHAPALNDSPQGDSDYDTILAALMGSARGRSFLQEYALRNRVVDTATLLTAIGRIEGLLTSRSLEPAVPSSADALPAPDSHQAEADTCVTIENGTCVAAAGATEIVPVVTVEVAARHVSAIEFLGPASDLPQPEPAKPPQVSTRAQPREPFADIRALSELEKIALFA